MYLPIGGGAEGRGGSSSGKKNYVGISENALCLLLNFDAWHI